MEHRLRTESGEWCGAARLGGRLFDMTGSAVKGEMHRYLQAARDVLVWYDIRRPMTATGTNLLGL